MNTLSTINTTGVVKLGTYVAKTTSTLKIYVEKPLFAALTMLFSLSSMTVHAEITHKKINEYTQNMSAAANAKNIQQLSQLISNDAIIAVNRNGITGTMNKNIYLKKLKESWSTTSNYQYSISASNIVLMGSSAKVNITTQESFVKNNKVIKRNTESKTTLKDDGNQTILLKAVSQVTIK